MIRFVLRFVGLLCLALAFIFLIYDGTRSIADQNLILTRLDDVWNWLYARPLQDVLRPMVERLFATWLWNPVILPLLRTPVWILLAVLGSILIVLGRKKKPLIGYARR
jgi:hypothetical protein